MNKNEQRKTWIEENLPEDYKKQLRQKKFVTPRRIGYGIRPAILVIDMYRAWTESNSPIGIDMTDTIVNIKKILDVARKTEPKIPILFTRSTRGLREGYLRKRAELDKSLEEGSPWLEIDPRLERSPDEPLIVKLPGSCFHDKDLIRILVSNRCDTLVLTGCNISVCIMTTACDALELGFRCIIPAEAVTDTDPVIGKYMLLNLDLKIADVEPLEEVLRYVSLFTKK
jgi:nicotinamidase-related amidase